MVHPISADLPAVGGRQKQWQVLGAMGARPIDTQGSLLGAVVATAQLCFEIIAGFCDSQMLGQLDIKRLTLENWTVASWMPYDLLGRQGRLIQS